MTTEVERLENRLFGDPEKKLKNFGFTIDKEAFAETYGGEYIPGDFGPFDGHIDWTNSPFTAEERTEGLAKDLNAFMDAAEDPTRSHRVSSSTDEWGNMLDEHHPDYMTFAERLEHVVSMRSKLPNREVKSRWEWEMVIGGFVSPADGMTVADYEAEWEQKQVAREENGWGRYPKVDPKDSLDGHLDVTSI